MNYVSIIIDGTVINFCTTCDIDQDLKNREWESLYETDEPCWEDAREYIFLLQDDGYPVMPVPNFDVARLLYDRIDNIFVWNGNEFVVNGKVTELNSVNVEQYVDCILELTYDDEVRKVYVNKVDDAHLYVTQLNADFDQNPKRCFLINKIDWDEVIVLHGETEDGDDF